MIFSAEQSGNLPKTLLKIGEIFESKIDTTTKDLTVILEPVLLVVVWAGVVAVALAVILPIYSLIGGFNAGANFDGPPPQTETPPADEDNGVDSEDVTKETIGEVAGERLVASIRITETGAGYVNVRNAPSLDGEIISKAPTGDEYVYLSEEDGWYEIVLPEEDTGWVFGEFAEVLSEEYEDDAENNQTEVE